MEATDQRIAKLFGIPPRSAPTKTPSIDAPFAWTEERVGLLKRLWKEGQSASKIAAELGHGVTRCSVLGKIHRLGLSRKSAGTGKRAKPPAREAVRASPPAASKIAERPASPEVSPTTIETTARLPAAEDRKPSASAGTARQPPTPVQAERPSADAVALHQLKRRHCRWPVDGPGGSILYCGAPKTDRPQGSLPCSYCARHADLAYAPRRTEQQRKGDEVRRQLALARVAATRRGDVLRKAAGVSA